MSIIYLKKNLNQTRNQRESSWAVLTSCPAAGINTDQNQLEEDWFGLCFRVTDRQGQKLREKLKLGI